MRPSLDRSIGNCTARPMIKFARRFLSVLMCVMDMVVVKMMELVTVCQIGLGQHVKIKERNALLINVKFVNLLLSARLARRLMFLRRIRRNVMNARLSFIMRTKLVSHVGRIVISALQTLPAKPAPQEASSPTPKSPAHANVPTANSAKTESAPPVAKTVKNAIRQLIAQLAKTPTLKTTAMGPVAAMITSITTVPPALPVEIGVKNAHQQAAPNASP